MQFSEDTVKEIGLSEEQVTKLTELTNNHESTIKGEWDGKANKDAEAIIEGAGQKTVSLTGIPRDQGEKWASYLERSSGLYFEGTKNSLERQKTELDEKIKSGGGDETLKTELADVKSKLDLLQQKEAKFADWEENDYKGKLEQTTKELSQIRVDSAFNGVKPNFPDTVNTYEAKGRWNEFKTKVLAENTIEKDSSGDWVAIDKENKHKITKLKDLVKQDTALVELSKGRDKKGFWANGKPTTSVDGVPFKVPENADSKERTKAIKEYLTGELNLAITSKEYSSKFAEYNKKLLEKNPA